MQLKITFDNTEFDQHAANKNRNMNRRKADIQNKAREAIRHARYQKTCDQYKRRLSKKGAGQAKKVKGRVLSTGIPCNDRTTKSWQRIGYGRNNPIPEGFKHFAIYDRT